MDILTFVVRIVETVVWPAVFLGALWLFRTPLGRLLDALRNAKMKYKKGDTTFVGELNTVREKAPSIPTLPPPRNIQKLVTEHPSEAIEKSWEELLTKASQAASVPKSTTIIKIADTLIDKRILNPSEGEALFMLYEIKERATKQETSGVPTDVSSASAFSGLAQGFATKITGTIDAKLEPFTMSAFGAVGHNEDHKKP